MKILSVNTSDAAGIAKNPRPEGCLVEKSGLQGDAHAGSSRQVSLLARESYEKHEKTASLPCGTYAENLTTEGLILHHYPVGTVVKAGEALLEITQIGKNCHNACEIRKLSGKCVMPLEGVFARVLVSGFVRPGDPVKIVENK
ncbi:MAG TPA: MOSC domain-containing protein [Firmicutes bacterium]|nr:MOSC domain-containing protein [Bacillota bacterium]